ncbi:MAG: glycerophosphoryl diester phosphodiesterase [Magnetovibrio sp.]|nr:glycerophosphoryl diester phosphodiesterase [Magnetovibrio sp.]
MTNRFPKLIAHRGASAQAPENTMPAFLRAVEVGAKAIEFDVTMSADGVPIVIHDETLDRTTNGIGPVVLKTWQELQALDAGSWFGSKYDDVKIPHLEEVLEFSKHHSLALNLEIKPTLGLEQQTVDAIVSALNGIDVSLVVSSFNERALAMFQVKAPEVELAYLTEAIPPDWVRRMAPFGAQAMHCWDAFVTQAVVDEIVNAGKTLRVYTVNDVRRAQQLWSWGVEAVFTDHPDKLIEVI